MRFREELREKERFLFFRGVLRFVRESSAYRVKKEFALDTAVSIDEDGPVSIDGILNNLLCLLISSKF